MKIWIAQVNTKLGDVEHNYQKIAQAIQTLGPGSDIIVFPEMTLPGYPLHDKVFDKNLLKAQKAKLVQVQKILKWYKKDLTVALGFVDYDDTKTGPDGQWIKRNAAAVIKADSIQVYHKQLLPNYDVFYDKRYYNEWTWPTHVRVGNQTAAITICEDMRDEWYEIKPVAQACKAQQTDLIINLSSSPFATGKLSTRLDIIRNHVKKHKIPFVYVNQIGWQDGNVNDGGSMVVNAAWQVIHANKTFTEDLCIVDTNNTMDQTKKVLETNNNKYGQILEAIKLGISDYMKKGGFTDIVIGVSGGVDSAVSLSILSMILPPERIHAYYLPSKHSQSEHFVKQLCKNTGVPFTIHDINSGFQAAISQYEQINRSKPTGIAYQNIQARERGQILGLYANVHNALIINNSNRTEIAQGYATIYGDTIGFLSVIGDLMKNEVYELAHYINTISWKDLIPQSIINRAASAELEDNQVDPFDYTSDCPAIDEIFCGQDLEVVIKKYGLSREKAERLKRANDRNEFKRVQSPRVIKLKAQSAWLGRLYPIIYG